MTWTPAEAAGRYADPRGGRGRPRLTRPAARFMVVGGLSSGREEALDVADAHGHACADARCRRGAGAFSIGALKLSCWWPASAPNRRAGSRPSMGLRLARLAPATESHPSLAEPVADALATFAANTGQLPSTIRFYAGPGPSATPSPRRVLLALRPGFASASPSWEQVRGPARRARPRFPEWSTTSSAPILPAGVGIPSLREVVHHDLWPGGRRVPQRPRPAEVRVRRATGSAGRGHSADLRRSRGRLAGAERSTGDPCPLRGAP